MPKRLLDSSLFTSPSLAAVSPRAQDAFPRFILCADDFGCLDANARALLGLAWPLRHDVTEADVEVWLGELAGAGMLQLWEAGGRRYGFLTGWHGPHGQRRREEYHPKNAPRGSKRRTPPPPPPVHRESPARETGGKPAGDSQSMHPESPAAGPPFSRPVPAHAVAVAGAETLQRQEASGGNGASLPEPKPAPPPSEADFARDLAAEHAGKARRKGRRPNSPSVTVGVAEVLGALPGTVAEVSERLGHPADNATWPGPRAVAATIKALERAGQVRDVTHADGSHSWERTA